MGGRDRRSSWEVGRSRSGREVELGRTGGPIAKESERGKKEAGRRWAELREWERGERKMLVLLFELVFQMKFKPF
jgi:hypothetical protein